MNKSHRRIILSMLLGIVCQRALPADTAESIPPLTYVHVYADAAGASHFREEHFAFTRGRDKVSSIHVLEAKGGATLLRLKAGAVEDWHNGKTHGHGFGLHSAAVAAQQLGGTISAESGGTGQGARFSVTIPINSAAQVDRVAAA